MATTPEGKVKKMVRDCIAEFVETEKVDEFFVHSIKAFWPVPNGMGASDIDCIVCYCGLYISIETKAPGEKPTPRQRLALAQTEGAGGLSLVIDGEEGVQQLREALQRIKNANYRFW